MWKDPEKIPRNGYKDDIYGYDFVANFRLTAL